LQRLRAEAEVSAAVGILRGLVARAKQWEGATVGEAGDSSERVVG
jgi:hypothetical protein